MDMDLAPESLSVINPVSCSSRNSNGKRERMNMEDDPEIMPLSKRMNNIHFDLEGNLSASSRNVNGVPVNQFGIHVPQFQPGVNNTSTELSQGRLGYPPNTNNGTFSQRNFNQIEEASNNAMMGNAVQNISVQDKESTAKEFHYCPALDRELNPYYFESNRILFELYKERLQRNGLQQNPDYMPS